MGVAFISLEQGNGSGAALALVENAMVERVIRSHHVRERHETWHGCIPNPRASDAMLIPPAGGPRPAAELLRCYFPGD
jgi:hypothetical protein